MSQFQQSFEMQGRMGMHQEGELELLKRMFVEANPWLLGITFVVSTLHMLFDVLAFRSDIAFWRRAKSMEGLSLKSVLLNVFFQVVILLYLIDNDTSWMVILSTGMGLAIEVWKVRKALNVSVHWASGQLLPVVDWEAKDER